MLRVRGDGRAREMVSSSASRLLEGGGFTLQPRNRWRSRRTFECELRGPLTV